MKIKHNNIIHTIETNNDTFYIDNVLNDIKIDKINENTFKVMANEKVFLAKGIKDKDKYYVNIEGRQYIFSEVEDDYGTSSKNEDRAEIYPPMPGSIVKIIVKVGDKVSEGDALILVEAMKMETTLYSPINGIVKEILVNEKEQVNPENYMILIQKE